MAPIFCPVEPSDSKEAPPPSVKAHSAKNQKTPIVRHLNAWKEIYTLLLAFLSAAFSGFALYLSMNANTIALDAARTARAATEIQKADFTVRTRPYIALAVHPPRFTGPETDAAGAIHQHNLLVMLRNLSDIPACNVQFFATLLADNQPIENIVIPPKTLLPRGAIDIVRDQEPRYPIPIPDSLYNTLLDTNHTISVAVQINYIGMVSNSPSYTTKLRLDYVPSINEFILSQQDI